MEKLSTRLSQGVARDLERAIEMGRYTLGARLPSERELAEQFRVSRPVIREATMALELGGLVRRKPGAGVFVSGRTGDRQGNSANDGLDGPFEVTEARRLLESEIAALAAATATDAQIDEMEEILSIISDMNVSQLDREQADRSFHLALARATTNDVLVGMIEDLWDKRYRSPLCVYFFSRARDAGIQPPVDEHRRVLEAIRARNPDAARLAMRDHLSRVTECLLHASEADVMDRARLRVEERRFDFARRAGLKVG
ncbi:FadR/GntR family transcriptional regulator [Sphingomonas crusticola]|uniref:FadR/GntR family transcriptional regulator n=1 Tax=Sphingomonas crusticola TaxID=1697973 RepID=UPI000E23CEF8|nr:FadR/GntR family transcriptional regulator [Sphingomonas crusticola]